MRQLRQIDAGDDAPPVTDRPTRVIEPTGGDEAVSDGLKYGVMAASLLIPLIGIVMGLYYMAKGDSEAKKGVGRLWLYVGIGIVVFYMAISGEF